MKKKNIFLAIFWGVVFPGLGLFYAGKTIAGIIFLVLGLLSILISMTGILAFIGLPLWLFSDFISFIMTIIAVKKYNKQLV